jgi:putative ABC transport system permease protein
VKYLPYVLKHLRRNWVRTGSTVLAMALCIFLFCTLRTILATINWALDSASASRLVSQHALSLVNNLPLAYKARIQAVPGVTGVAAANWFGGSLPAKKEGKADEGAGAEAGPDFSNFFESFAVEADDYFAMYPEYVVPPATMQAFKQDLQGCLIGPGLAQKYGWKEGDRFHLESFIPPYRKSSGPFEFTVRGIYGVDDVRHQGTNAKLMFFHHKYLWEGTGQRVGAGVYTISIADPEQAGTVSKAIDELFDNSDSRTKTSTEAAFAASFTSMLGNVALLLNGIGLAGIFTILLVTGNTMSMAVRDRRTEIAVLKTLGFSSARVMALILGEALLLGVLGGGLGLALSGAFIRTLPHLPMIGALFAQFPNFGLSGVVGATGFTVAVFVGLAAGFVPALLSYRARITEMLRQV